MSQEDLERRLHDFTNGIVLKPDTPQQSLTELPRDGCIVLGHDAGRGNRYLTRFQISRERQHEVAHTGLFYKECLPCCIPGKNYNCGKLLWNIIRSEAFVLTLHVSVLVLGVLKEALNLREVDEDLHLVHSILETFVTCLVVVIRTVSTWHAFKELRHMREENEILGEGLHWRHPSIRKALTSYTVLAAILIVLDWVAFFLFKYIEGAHLGWTILSNNFTLLVVTITSNQVLGRITHEITRISEDHHKAVIYEATLLLTECAMADSPEKKNKILQRVEKFCKALRDTELFTQPDYITIPDELKPHWDMITTMQVVSMV